VANKTKVILISNIMKFANFVIRKGHADFHWDFPFPILILLVIPSLNPILDIVS